MSLQAQINILGKSMFFRDLWNGYLLKPLCDFSSIIPWKIQMCFISDLQYVGDFELQ